MERHSYIKQPRIYGANVSLILGHFQKCLTESGNQGNGNQGNGNQGNNEAVHFPEPPLNEGNDEGEPPSLPPSLFPEEEERPATPSEARQVCWEVRFVDEKDKNIEIFQRQHGISKEGTELSIDFPETLQAQDQRYQAMTHSPFRIVVTGFGIQKYEIIYKKVEPLPESSQESQEQAAMKRLSDWLIVAAEADSRITGQPVENWPLITGNQRESGERMKNLISMVRDGERHELYLISKDHIPSTVIISQAFPDVIGISELLVDEFDLSGACYHIVRIGFCRTWDVADCTHELECVEHVAATCLSGGHDTYRCLRCGYEEALLLPASGHVDEAGDGICDVCCQPVIGEEELEGTHFQIGDIQIRNIAGKPYRFRCIDEDYKAGRGKGEAAALFLCDTVIRPDQEEGWGTCGTGFGSTNNYKISCVRRWIQASVDAASNDLIFSYIGVNTAYQGATASGEYEQFLYDELQSYEKPFQMMEDQIFLLSLEEAVQYREILWKFNGSQENNPETQYSPASRGYFLRTPQYEGRSGFEYGKSIYAVDLADGSLHPVNVSDTSMGIRPAITVKQN